MWREGLGAYKIITENRTDLTYWKHPATQEFVYAPMALWYRLELVRLEMLERGYHPKLMPKAMQGDSETESEWQTLDEQIAILKSKHCQCKV